MVKEIEQRIKEASEKAQEAFWNEIVKAFPEAKYGDIAPELIIAFDEMCEKVITHWVNTNTNLISEDNG